MAIISAQAVEKRVFALTQPIDILKGVDLDVNEGETLAILGASGSGKTTLLSLLAGLDTPTQGEIILQGIKLARLTEDERATVRLGRVGFVFQNFDLLPQLTAIENVMLPLELQAKPDARQMATDILHELGLKERLKHYPRQLSGGEQQRVAIARAFVTQPKVLFADEPTGCLDTKTGEKIMALLFDLNAKHQTTLIFVTHDSGLAQRCQRRVMLVDGKLTT
ncbi:ABC transporter ATP-binding protein [Candidatus Berkiella aquae]|uniref:ABC transporter ATP-binding protein n=1 Tax=Candidatus Berkiella aquae TaxID=295108 RepID=A0A0Q9YN53_9GAMM|nr:ABC transporter ATP-binding protein [Candidatus Berkiella aquae]